MSKITLIGMYNYMPELFDKMTIPTGVNKDTLIDTMLLKSDEFEVVYPDPNFMQNVLGLLSARWYATFDRWVKALAVDYNPLENYDRYEEYTDSTSHSFSNKDESQYSNDTQSTSNSTVDHDDETTHGTQTTEVTVSAMNSSSYVPDSKSETSQLKDTYKNDETVNTSNHVTAGDSGSTNRSGSDSGKVHHTARLHGNIGVTTSQQMLESEMDLASRWANLYDHMADTILRDIVIPVY